MRRKINYQLKLKEISTKREQLIDINRRSADGKIIVGGSIGVKSLLITIMRNVLLFIPAVMILNSLWQLNGVIAAQPIVETVLAIICIVMYIKDSGTKKSCTA